MKKLQALFVEDETRYRRALVNEMAEYNIECAGEASNGIECLTLLMNVEPDVIVLDLEMPVMDGSETFDEIKLRHPMIPVIILSHHDETGLIENYIYRGAKGFIPKSMIYYEAKTLADGIIAVKAEKPFFPSYEVLKPVRYTKKEVAIIPYMIDGKTSKEIANELGMEHKKVSKLRMQLHKKTNTRNAPEFVKYGVLKGLNTWGSVKNNTAIKNCVGRTKPIRFCLWVGLADLNSRAFLFHPLTFFNYQDSRGFSATFNGTIIFPVFYNVTIPGRNGFFIARL